MNRLGKEATKTVLSELTKEVVRHAVADYDELTLEEAVQLTDERRDKIRHALQTWFEDIGLDIDGFGEWITDDALLTLSTTIENLGILAITPETITRTYAAQLAQGFEVGVRYMMWKAEQEGAA